MLPGVDCGCTVTLVTLIRQKLSRQRLTHFPAQVLHHWESYHRLRRQAAKIKGQLHSVLLKPCLPVYRNGLILVQSEGREDHWFHLQHSRHNTGRRQEKGVRNRRVCGVLFPPKESKLLKGGELVTLNSSANVSN